MRGGARRTGRRRRVHRHGRGGRRARCARAGGHRNLSGQRTHGDAGVDAQPGDRWRASLGRLEGCGARPEDPGLRGRRDAAIQDDGGGRIAADEDEPIPAADELVERAWKSSLLGFLAFPPLFHLWALWLLRRAWSEGGPRTERGRILASRALLVSACAPTAFIGLYVCVFLH